MYDNCARYRVYPPELDFELDGFNPSDFDFMVADSDEPPRYMKPKIFQRKTAKARYADELESNIEITKNSSHYIFLNGSFVFGDFLFKLIENKNIHVLKMHLATLSLSEDNILKLAELMRRDFIDSLDLHVSAYFFANERRSIVPIIYKELDIDNKFQFVVSSNHCKICLMSTEGGKKIVMHGSANLRSSNNVEQLEITEDEELYEFNRQFLDTLAEKYKTINKPIRMRGVPWD